MKSKIFIGSTVEGLKIAYAIQENLDNFGEITVWDQGVFNPSGIIINKLLQSLNNSDFGVFVFYPDDVTIVRDVEKKTVRDNLIFELGLFVGRLGMEKVFFVTPKDIDKLHLPTDLLGVISGNYDANRSDGNLKAALRPFCNQIKEEMERVINIKKGSPNELTNDLKIIKNYLKDRNITFISFEKLITNVHPRFDENHITKLIEAFPDHIRRGKIKGNKTGIKLLQ